MTEWHAGRGTAGIVMIMMWSTPHSMSCISRITADRSDPYPRSSLLFPLNQLAQVISEIHAQLPLVLGLPDLDGLRRIRFWSVGLFVSVTDGGLPRCTMHPLLQDRPPVHPTT